MELRFNITAIKQIETHFSLNPDFRLDNYKTIEIGYGINVSFKNKHKVVNVIVSIFSEDKTQPFLFNITTAGLFNFNKLPRKDEIEKAVYVYCAPIIFPYIRESIADLTRRAGLPPLHIDPVDFIGMYEKQKNAQIHAMRRSC